MSETIQAGDLLMVVTACCQDKKRDHLGETGTASYAKLTFSYCGYCGHQDNGQHWALVAGAHGAPAWWYKRIPPLSELEGEKRDEPIKGPA